VYPSIHIYLHLRNVCVWNAVSGYQLTYYAVSVFVFRNDDFQADRAQNEFDGRAVPTSQGELIQRSSKPLTEFMEKRDVERGLEEKATKDRKGNGERKGRDGK